MSTLSVDTIQGQTTASTIKIPGHVVQVVEGTATAQTVHNTTSYAATSVTASITPKFATSKILVSLTSNLETNSAGEFGWYSLFRGSTNIIESQVGQPNGGGSPIFPITLQRLDSPATTSTITYALYIKRTSATIVANINSGGINSVGVITLMEIAQ